MRMLGNVGLATLVVVLTFHRRDHQVTSELPATGINNYAFPPHTPTRRDILRYSFIHFALRDVMIFKLSFVNQLIRIADVSYLPAHYARSPQLTRS